ncbi:hypothetical protein MTO96_002031 [Rhipicephalus appendiculatus]
MRGEATHRTTLQFFLRSERLWPCSPKVNKTYAVQCPYNPDQKVKRTQIDGHISKRKRRSQQPPEFVEAKETALWSIPPRIETRRWNLLQEQLP